MIYRWIETLFPTMLGRNPAWPKLRDAHLLIEGECAACGTRKGLEVHHIEPVHVAPQLEMDVWNLMTLCQRCHLFVGHLGAWQSWNEHARFDATQWLRKIRRRP